MRATLFAHLLQTLLVPFLLFSSTMRAQVGILTAAALAFTQTAAAPTPAQWAALNQTVGGRLHGGIPLAEPCYSNYNGTKVTPNATACNDIQNGYQSDAYLAQSYSGFMNVRPLLPALFFHH